MKFSALAVPAVVSLRTRRVVAPTFIVAFALLSTACEKTQLTDPISSESGLEVRAQRDALPSVPSPTTYSPTTQTSDQVKLCKDATSPVGVYTFNIASSDTQSGDQVATSATLSPGQCTIIFNRTGHTTTFGSFATLQITEVVPNGAAHRVKQVNLNDKDGIRTVPGPTVAVKVNGYHGAVANYVNEAVQVTPPPGPVTGPVTAANGTIHVCKAGSVAGSFTFTTSATGTTGTDQTTSSVTLTSGQCQVVFFRPTAGTTAASVTITEGASSTTILTGATVNAAAATLAGRSLTVSQGMEAGKVIIFTNANNTPAIGVPFTGPATPGTGLVYVCKSANSPAGSYTFATNVYIPGGASGLIAGDQVQASLQLQPGQCALVFSRPAAGPVAVGVNVREVVSANGMTTVAGGMLLSSTGQLVYNFTGNTAGPQPVTLPGGVVLFTNVASGSLIGTAYPGVQTPGRVVVCKNQFGAVGTFTFTIAPVSGVLVSDQLATSVTINNGQCATVFLRTTASATPAQLTITENAEGRTVVTQIVRVDGTGTVTLLGPGRVVTATENASHGTVITYTNDFLP